MKLLSVNLSGPKPLESAKKLLAEGVPHKEVDENLTISIPTLYRWLPASER